MFEQVVNSLEAEFGPRTKGTAKVEAWQFRPDAGVVLERPLRESRDCAWAWVPQSDAAPPPSQARPYAADQGRHSNTYSIAGLHAGRPALRIPLRSRADIEELVSYLKRLPEIPQTTRKG